VRNEERGARSEEPGEEKEKDNNFHDGIRPDMDRAKGKRGKDDQENETIFNDGVGLYFHFFSVRLKLIFNNIGFITWKNIDFPLTNLSQYTKTIQFKNLKRSQFEGLFGLKMKAKKAIFQLNRAALEEILTENVKKNYLPYTVSL